MMRAPLTLIVGGILLVLTEGEGASGLHFSDEDWDDPEALTAGLLSLVCCCVGFGFWILNCLLQVGFAGATQRVMVTGEERFSDLFRRNPLMREVVRIAVPGVAERIILNFGLLSYFWLLSENPPTHMLMCTLPFP